MSHQLPKVHERIEFLSTAYTDVIGRVGIDASQIVMNDRYELEVHASETQRRDFGDYYNDLRQKNGYLQSVYDQYAGEYDSNLSTERFKRAKAKLGWLLICVGAGERLAGRHTESAANGVYSTDIPELSLGAFTFPAVLSPPMITLAEDGVLKAQPDALGQRNKYGEQRSRYSIADNATQGKRHTKHVKKVTRVPKLIFFPSRA